MASTTVLDIVHILLSEIWWCFLEAQISYLYVIQECRRWGLEWPLASACIVPLCAITQRF